MKNLLWDVATLGIAWYVGAYANKQYKLFDAGGSWWRLVWAVMVWIISGLLVLWVAVFWFLRLIWVDPPKEGVGCSNYRDREK